MSEEQQASFNGWAKVEVMGHQSHIGYVKTEAYGAAVLFRIDTPTLPEREYVLDEPSYVDGKWTGAGAKVLRAERPGCTVMVGAGSIYRIVPCSEAAALKAIDATQRGELKLIEPPPAKAISAGDSFGLEDEDGEPDTCDDCGLTEEHCQC